MYVQIPDAALSSITTSGDSSVLAVTDVVSSAVVVDELDRTWDGLAETSGMPMGQSAWTHACADILFPHKALRVAVAKRDDLAVAIMPLFKSRLTGRLEIPGARELGEPFDAVYTDAGAAASLADAVARLNSPIYLQRMDASSPLIPALEQAFKGRGVTFKRAAPSYPWIPLHEGWKEPESQLSSRRRSDFRRAARHAEKVGRVGFEMLSPTPDEVPGVLDAAFQTEAKSWKGSTGSAMALNAKIGTFFRRYAASAAEKGALRVSFLRMGEQIAAMQIAVESGGRYWLLKMGYNHEFSKSSPGMLLIAETVREAAERGLRSYELLGTVESWTHVWTESERPCVSFFAFPLRPAGLTDLAAEAAIFAWKRAKSQFKNNK